MSVASKIRVVVGDAGLDVMARPAGPIVADGDVRARVRVTIGGAGANTAVWLTRCGVDATLVTRVGDDLAGEQVCASLTEAGVRCSFAVDAQLPTCCVVVLVDGHGGRSMLSDRGANARLDPADPDRDLLDGARHLHLSGYALLDESSVAAGTAARAAGLTTSVDPQAAPLINDPPGSSTRSAGSICSCPTPRNWPH